MSGKHTYHPIIEDDAALATAAVALRVWEILREIFESLAEEPPSPMRTNLNEDPYPSNYAFTKHGLMLCMSATPNYIVTPWGDLSLGMGHGPNAATELFAQRLAERGVVLQYVTTSEDGHHLYSIVGVDGVRLPMPATSNRGAFEGSQRIAAAHFAAALAALRSA